MIGAEKKEVKARLVQPNAAALEECGKRIREGKLVAFPTETVYGLGADATNEEAVKSIFAAKERPFTDPVIVHIADLDMVDKIIKTEKEKTFIKEVGKVLWPGPLTMIGPVNDEFIPRMVGSNTGSIGVRYPNHPIAQALIRAAKTPIAAPSANKFMHVSPTKGSHVFDDLKYEDVVILDGEMSDLGVESTVVHVEWVETHYRVTLLRTGTFDFEDIKHKVLSLPQFSSTEFTIRKRQTNTEKDTSVAPGQLLKHYSPYVLTFLASPIEHVTPDYTLQEYDVDTIGVIDFGRHNVALKSLAKHYVDLDEEGDYKRAMQRLYDELRRAETIPGLKALLLVNLSRILGERELSLNPLADKTFRSAAGAELFYTPDLKIYTSPNKK